MATKAASRRLGKEYVAMQKESPPFIWACPEESNILTWHYIIRGPPDSPYAGGEYHGVLLFPSEYPFKPPGIKMFTPSGRFQCDKRICFSMSDFHPGSWNPAWSVATILTGLLSFMLSDEMTTGGMQSRDSDKRMFATQSHAWNLRQKKFKEVFPDYCTPTPRDVPNMGERDRGKADESKKKAMEPSAPTTAVPSSTLTATNPTPRPPQQAQPTGATADPVVDVPARAGSASGWSSLSSWVNAASGHWRWGLFLVIAVVVSRLSSSR